MRAQAADCRRVIRIGIAIARTDDNDTKFGIVLAAGRQHRGSKAAAHRVPQLAAGAARPTHTRHLNDHAAIKDALEALGIPHTEVDRLDWLVARQ